MSDGAPREPDCDQASKIMQPNDDVRMKGQIGLPTGGEEGPRRMHQPGEGQCTM